MSLTGSRRTSGCLESKLGRSERGCRRRAAACGLGARRRDGSGEVWARGKSLGAARGRGGANGGGCRGGAGLGWRLRGGVKLVGVHGGAAACSGVWTRGESKGASEIESWDSCSAQARERARAGPLVWALHGDVAVAAAGEVLGAAGRRGEGWRVQREATGGGGARPRRVGASARRIDGREGREGAPRR